MRVFQAFNVSKSFYEPKVDVGPNQDRLNGLQRKGEVG